MAGSGLSINNVVITIVAVALGITLIGSLLAPVASDVINDLTSKTSAGVAKYANGDTWASLVSVVVMMCIVGLILVAINNYTRKN